MNGWKAMNSKMNKPSPEFDAAAKQAIDQFTETVNGFNTQDQAVSYSLMMISMATKLIQGTHGTRFKKEFLEAAIQDQSFIMFTDLKPK